MTTRTILPAVSRKRKGQQRPRRIAVDALRAAQDGMCPRCGGHFGSALHGHERRGMAHGADYTRPDVALCDPCNGWVEDNPIAAAFTGWKISGKHPHAPELENGEAYNLAGDIVIFGDLAGEQAS